MVEPMRQCNFVGYSITMKHVPPLHLTFLSIISLSFLHVIIMNINDA